MSEAARTAVFVHGAGGGGWEWNVWARVFAAQGFAVIAPDLVPGPQGLAKTILDDYLGQVADWLGEARRRQPGGRLCLVGASLGGLLALANGSAADAMVLVNALPATGLPSAKPVPDIVAWGSGASLAGTRRAVPEAEDLAALYAFRRWRDESGLALRQARAGLVLASPCCPALVIASDADADVPPDASAALASQLGADLVRVAGSHVAPLLGRSAAPTALQAVEWLNGIVTRR